MLRKILLVMNLIFILSMGVVCAAERTYEVTDGGCIVSLPATTGSCQPLFCRFSAK